MTQSLPKRLVIVRESLITTLISISTSSIVVLVLNSPLKKMHQAHAKTLISDLRRFSTFHRFLPTKQGL